MDERLTKEEARVLLAVLDCHDFWTTAGDIGANKEDLRSAIKKLEKIAGE